VRESYYWIFDGTARPSVPEISRLFGTLRIYAAVILANGWLLILWGLYNQIRFRGPHPAAESKSVTVEDLASLYQIPANDIAIWQNSRILTMRHGADGTLEDVIVQDGARGSRTPPGEPATSLANA